MRLITPPLPAASRPSKTSTTRRPACLTQCCSFTSSSCSRASSRSYSFRFSLEGEPSSFSRSTGAAASSLTVHLSSPGRHFSSPCRPGTFARLHIALCSTPSARGNLLRDRRQFLDRLLEVVYARSRGRVRAQQRGVPARRRDPPPPLVRGRGRLPRALLERPAGGDTRAGADRRRPGRAGRHFHALARLEHRPAGRRAGGGPVGSRRGAQRLRDRRLERPLPAARPRSTPLLLPAARPRRRARCRLPRRAAPARPSPRRPRARDRRADGPLRALSLPAEPPRLPPQAVQAALPAHLGAQPYAARPVLRRGHRLSSAPPLLLFDVAVGKRGCRPAVSGAFGHGYELHWL